MRSQLVWADRVHDKEGNRQSIHALAFQPDGTRLIAGGGHRVLVYETADGQLLSSLKGHKDNVYCIAYQPQGQFFASGGADSQVIIWNASQLKGALKYTHNDPIQALAFNPVSGILVSCAATDFAFWSADDKSVEKIRLNNTRICSCSWTNDGEYVALGLFNGNISIRNTKGVEKVNIARPNAGPAWTLQWNPSAALKTDVLAVGDWDQKLNFYMLSGRRVSKERALGYDPCSVSYFSSGEYLVVSGSNRKVGLYTRDGIHLNDIATHEGWIWSCATRPNDNYVAVGCQDGTIALHQLNFSTVHSLFKNLYAVRDNMTDVVVRDLERNTETRVKCRELVKKIAVYKDHLAVQLPNQINVYALQTGDPPRYSLISRMGRKEDCNLLVVTAKHVVLCQEKRLQSFTFDNQQEREWTTESVIRYIKVVGGPPGNEGILLGLGNGAILQVFLNNPFATELIKQTTSITCLDINSSRQKLAVVDENNVCLVYDLNSKQLLFQEPHANSVSWNSQNEDMLCYSGNGQLHIKAANFPVHSQKMQGFVVGFAGPQVYCLHVQNMSIVEVPQSHSMFQYLDKGLFEAAYSVACLGVTDADWRALAIGALEGLNLEVAKKAFARVHETRYLNLIQKVEDKERATGERDADDIVRAQVYAYQGRFDEAAKLYNRAGESRMAMNMFIDLRRFDRAKTFLDPNNSEDTKTLMRAQAEWCKTANDPTLAIDLLTAAGEELASVNMMGENGMVQKLVEKGRDTATSEVEILERIIYWLKQLNHVSMAAEICEKLGDPKLLIQLYAECKRWDEAFAVANRHPEHLGELYGPYAEWLVSEDRFQEAQLAYRQAGQENKAIQLLEVLAHNAVVERRFDDAAYLHHLLALVVKEQLLASDGEQDASLTDKDPAVVAKYEDLEAKADIYSCYDKIYRYIVEPFTAHSTEALLHNARYLLNIMPNRIPYGVSKFNVLYAISKIGKELGAYKLARYSYDQLQKMRFPPEFRAYVHQGAVAIRSKPLDDDEDLLPLCFRCSHPNPLLSGTIKCTSCHHNFFFSGMSREVLPLVEFHLELDIDDFEAQRLIIDDSGVGAKRQQWNEAAGAQVMSMDDDADGGDPFIAAFSRFEGGSTHYEPLRVDRDMLKGMPSNEVFFWVDPSTGMFRYCRNVLPEMPVRQCPKSLRFFTVDEWDLYVLTHVHTPFARLRPEESEDLRTKQINATQSTSEA
ncbi:uncharacterized protein MONBRDRAFT_26180 [Monosiga brevicollis MX1]|uniref:Intraflagellar transport protein 122 homolog n=1 Tax=Monosiga brevicollis TaxID=81824 RepID=A9V1L1_MONBE|nr:uncharacterized protein MONBRDRAFT_26180 [Monosiga brevicollis MX1]EDQ88458.1 predicted protein [Monosiga brevicollis MX1]|eukprot:XP_001746562.1 hypothetical protein [Monosiga brevicollis MX1]